MLSRQGQSRAAIVANGYEEQAKELAAYLTKISGAEYPVIGATGDIEDGMSAIVLDVAENIPGVSDERTGQQGYRIHTAGDRLHLTGRTEQGLTYAVYGFLDEHLGVRFFAPDVEVIPARPTMVIGPLDDRQEPAFLSRAFSYPYGHPLAKQEPEYREKNRGNTPRISAHHNFYKWIPPGKHFDDHPEWFPLIDGERRTHHAMGLCATNEELAAELAENFMNRSIHGSTSMKESAQEERFAGYPPIVSAGQGDGFVRCECPECRALARREGTEAAPYVKLLNRALEITSRKYPDNNVITYAYFATLPPPKNLRPHPNLWINIVSSSRSLYPAADQLGPIRDNPHNRDYREAIEGWTGPAAGRVAIWEWTGNFTDPTIEWPNIFSVADNIRFYHENEVEAVFLEQPNGAQNWGWMRKWMWARLMWDPGLDPRALAREFIEGYYGEKATPFLWEYHKFVDRVARESRYASATVRWTAYPSIIRRKLFTDERLHAMAALLEGALHVSATEEDPVYHDRVRQAIGTSIDTLLLTDAGAPTRVEDPRDGSVWLVPGGRPDFPRRTDRVADAWLKTTAAGAESWHFRYRFLQRTGGKLHLLDNEDFALQTLPAVRGQIYSLVHAPTGSELLAPGGDMRPGGYTDRLPGATSTVGWQEKQYHEHWIEGEIGTDEPGHLTMIGVPVTSPWHTPRGYLRRRQRYQLRREIILEPEKDGLRIARRYMGRRIKRKAQVFEAVWSFAVPDPARAALTVRERDDSHTFDLGRLEDAKGRSPAEDRPIALTDVMIQDFDVTEGRALTLELEGEQGDVVIRLDRGDGLAVELRTPAAGNRTVALTPHLSEGRVTVAVGTTPRALPAEDNEAEVELPVQRLRVIRAEPDGQDTEIRTRKNPKDGAEMVWIPAGHFRMGTPFGEANPDESPQRRIYLDGYWIYKYPVTVAQYRAFCEATDHKMPNLPDESSGEKHPIFQVNWHDARAYARWAGASLPTEAQWEKAARGVDGRRYPWGNEWKPELNVSMAQTHGQLRYGTRPVGSHPRGASPYGVMDMAGQVWEWVADWYGPQSYRTMRESNPSGPDRGEMKVLRGGSLNWDKTYSRNAYRNLNPPEKKGWVYTGFRCVVEER